MPNLVNRMVVRDLTEAFRSSSSLVVVAMTGLTMEENDLFRDELAQGGVSIHMVRNALAKIALQECGYQMPDGVFEGNVGIAVGEPEHAIHAAKVVSKSKARKDGKLKLRAGVIEGQILDESRATELADMPDRNTLRAMLLGVISGPARTLVGIVNAPTAALVRVVQANVDAKGGEAAA